MFLLCCYFIFNQSQARMSVVGFCLFVFRPVCWYVCSACFPLTKVTAWDEWPQTDVLRERWVDVQRCVWRVRAGGAFFVWFVRPVMTIWPCKHLFFFCVFRSFQQFGFQTVSFSWQHTWTLERTICVDALQLFCFSFHANCNAVLLYG